MSRFFILCLCFASFLVVERGEAHQTKISGSVSVLQHADPNDDPIIGTSSVLYLHFSDTQAKFKGEECNCVVYVAPYDQLNSIEATGSQFVFGSEEVRHLYGENYAFPYVFPRKGIYAIVVVGTPKDGQSFEPFRIVFDLRVDRGSGSSEAQSRTSSMPHTTHSHLMTALLITGTAFILGIVGILIRKYIYIKK